MIEFRPPRNEKEWENYYDLRYRILREPLGKERGSEKNEGDELGEHICLYDNGILKAIARLDKTCLLYTSPSPRDATLSRMPSSA